MNQFICSIQFPYTEYIIQGHKIYEIRTKIPKNLKTGDRIYVVESGTHGKILFHFLVGKILMIDPELAWARYNFQLGISLEKFRQYVNGKDKIFLIEITSISNTFHHFNVADLGFKRAPNWFYKLK